MFIVEIIGGLGNQMFCYAFSLALKNHYGENSVRIYTGRFKEVTDNRGFELDRIFHIDDNVIEEKAKIQSLLDVSMSKPAKLRRRLFGAKPSYFQEKIFRYDPSVFNLNAQTKDIYMQGLWQDELYFKDIRQDVLEKFSFKLEMDDQNKSIAEKIKSTNSVSLHVRRGDYVSNPTYANILGNVCTMDYYMNALQDLEKREKQLAIFVFSDDVEWVKANFGFLKEKQVSYINHNKGSDSYNDMRLMSCCKHNIIANSTFSWWGAWLNPNEHKRVYAPKYWFKDNKDTHSYHIVPDDWIKVDN